MSHFFRVWWKRSTFPQVWGWLGREFFCWMPRAASSVRTVAGGPAAAAAGEPGRVDQAVVGEHRGGEAVSCDDSAELGQHDGAGDGPVGGAAEQVAGVVVEPVQDLHVACPSRELPVGEVGLPDWLGSSAANRR